MSVSGIPVEHDMSASSGAIEACLARVREHAGLDEDPVLPPLHVVVGRKEPAVFVRRPSPPPPVALGLRVTPSSLQPSSPSASVRTEESAPVARVRRTTWPVVFCAFVVGITGGASLMMSPLGDAPEVQSVVKVARHHVVNATSAAKSLL